MKVLVIGSGGREHALCWKIKQSPQCTELYCAPGNGGIAQVAECLNIQPTDMEGLLRFAKDKGIDLTIVGPEAPLVDGIVNVFEAEGLKVFGPSQYASQLEGSKVFAKQFMHRWSIPTAAFKAFDDLAKAREFVSKARFPLVVKADGLAAGKGVIICKSQKEADEALTQIMEDKIFQDAGECVVLEECLEGEEVSILAISDGENYLIFESSQDHKRIFDDDMGPNTGGMGAYSPAPIANESLLKNVETRVIEPAIRGMFKEGHPFKGILYAGIMVTKEGPKVLEFNVRFGDPEVQAILPRLENDLLDVLTAAAENRLHEIKLDWDARACVCVVMSSGGYPGSYEKGKAISGLQDAHSDPDTVVFHAGTKVEEGKIVTSGGRVLGVTSLGDGIENAIEKAYDAVEKIEFEHCFFRRDIGAKALKMMGRNRVISRMKK